VITIRSIATALPEHTIGEDEVEARLREGFLAAGEDGSLVRQVFANSGVQRRHLARPPAFYLAERGLTARNAAYSECARELGERAARAALDAAGVAADRIDIVVDTSCTGVMIPALDAHLAGALGLRRDVRRFPLTEAGCAAGATALALVHELLRSREGATALIVALELPSLTLQLHDTSRANLVSSAIFGDGCAALVVGHGRGDGAPSRPAIEHVAHRTVLLPGSTDVMGFDLRTEGFQIVLSQRIPMLVRRHLREEVDAFLEAHGLLLSDLRFHALHPGGAKVLDNVRDALDLSEADVAASRRSLRDLGNLSSASVCFVAKDLLDAGAIAPGAPGLLVAMGPGFTIELALLRGARD
jgi:alkylresorcinol/alkylpyrone synthase